MLSVDDQIEEDLLQLVGVGQDDGQFRGQVLDDGDAVVLEEFKNLRSPITDSALPGIDRLLKQAENFQL